MTTKITRSNIASTGVAAGSYSAADITVNSSGQVTSASTSSIAASGGGGPKISGVVVTDSSWATLDDTAVDVLGGYIKITGSGFSSGCLVYFNQTPASSVSFVSSTELRVTTGALSAGTYVVYAINTDGGVAISVPGVTFSATPVWQTSSTLSDQYDGVAITLSLVAQEATSYTLVSGSLPPGLSLNASTGAITGTVTGVTVDTTYTFTVRATDAQNQDSPRTFTVTIVVSDPHFSKTTLLLSGSAISANTVLRDSSTNNFNLTAFGDTRASNFTPYGTGWSVYFDGTGDYLSVADNAGLELGSSSFCIEVMYYATSLPAAQAIINKQPNPSTDYGFRLVAFNGVLTPYISSGNTSDDIVNGTTFGTLQLNAWNHIAIYRVGTAIYGSLNGTITTLNASTSLSVWNNTAPWNIGASNTGTSGSTGYFSNWRIVIGSGVYTSSSAPIPTSPLTAITNTQLLTCQSNRFLDSSTNNFAITRNGDAAIRSFNPFNITNTGVDGSMYFDGTGDYLSAAYNSAFDLGSSNFTLEAWLYTSDSSSNFPSIVGRWQGSGTACWDLRPRSTERGNFLVFVYSTDGTNAAFVDSNGPALSDNAWHHVVAVRSGNNFALFVDGTRRNTANLSGVTIFNSASAPLNVGYDSWGTTYFTGYLSNVRVVKGTAVYDPTQTTLTVPTAPLTAVANTQLLTLQYKQPHNNHSFQDSSTNNHLITRSGNASQGTFSPFSQTGWSNYFNGSSYISTPGFNFSTSDFTIECFINSSSVAAGPQPISGYTTAGNNYAVALTSGGVYKFYLSSNGSTWDIASNVVLGTATAGTWHHIVIVRSGSSIRGYFDGTGGTTITSSAAIYNNSTAFYIGAAGSVGGNLTGYCSNVRVLLGTAAYNPASSTITVPTAPFATGTTNQVLLTCQANRFIDSNTATTAKTVTTNGSPSVQAFSPFAATAVYNPMIHGGSVYVDGSGDYLTPQAAAIPTGAGTAFTIEAWIYPISVASTAGLIGIGTNGSYLDWYVNVNAQLMFDIKGTTAVTSSASNAIKLNQWQHVALTRTTGNLYTLYINGQTVGTPTVNNTSLLSSSSYYIFGGGPQYGSQFRITPALVYTGNFTPPTLGLLASSSSASAASYPSTANVNTTFGSCGFLLNFTDAAIIDSTGRNVLETVADAKTSSVQVKYGTGSMYFDGTGDRILSSTNPVLLLSTSDWTVEFWLYKITGGGINAVVCQLDNGSTYGTLIGYESSSNLLVYMSYSGSSWDIASGQLLGTVQTNTWVHYAVTRSGSTFRTFQGGIQQATWTNTSSIYQAANAIVLGNGQGFGSTTNLAGYVDDFRITRGYARYTSNFTPPTGPHGLK